MPGPMINSTYCKITKYYDIAKSDLPHINKYTHNLAGYLYYLQRNTMSFPREGFGKLYFGNDICLQQTF